VNQKCYKAEWSGKTTLPKTEDQQHRSDQAIPEIGLYALHLPSSVPDRRIMPLHPHEISYDSSRKKTGMQRLIPTKYQLVYLMTVGVEWIAIDYKAPDSPPTRQMRSLPSEEKRELRVAQKMNLTATIAQAVDLLRRQLDDISVYRELVAHGIERSIAARLVEFLPIVYCRLLLARSGVHFAETYCRVLPNGTRTSSRPFSGESLWNELMTFAEVEIATGVKRPQVLAIAGRSAEWRVVNELLRGKAPLEDVWLTEPDFLWPESPDPSF
jgi:hypothetical protein